MEFGEESLQDRKWDATGDNCGGAKTSITQLENQQEIFISSPIASKDPISIPPVRYSKTNVVCGSSEISAIGM